MSFHPMIGRRSRVLFALSSPFFAALVVVCVLLSFADTHTKDDTQVLVSRGGVSPDSATGMPL
jgi:hypothetical protein